MIAKIGDKKVYIKLTDREMSIAGLELDGRTAEETASDPKFLERFASLTAFPINLMFNIASRGRPAEVKKFSMKFTFTGKGGVAELIDLVLNNGDPWKRVTEGSTFRFEITEDHEIFCSGAHVLPPRNNTEDRIEETNEEEEEVFSLDAVFEDQEAFLKFLLSEASKTIISILKTAGNCHSLLYRMPEEDVCLRLIWDIKDWNDTDLDILNRAACILSDYSEILFDYSEECDLFAEIFPIGDLKNVREEFLKGFNETTKKTQLL